MIPRRFRDQSARRNSGPPGKPDRGQTPLDFAVGAGVFLIAVAFVFTFAPTMFEPFAESSGNKLLVADRTATVMAGDVLGSAATPGTISAGCVGAFFATDELDDDDRDTLLDEYCDGELTADELNGSLAEFHQLDGYDVEIRIEYFNGTEATLDIDNRFEELSGYGEITLTRGDDSPTFGDVANARRVVQLDGTQYRLVVRVW